MRVHDDERLHANIDKSERPRTELSAKVSFEWAARENVPHVAPSLKRYVSSEHHRGRERRTHLSTPFSVFRCRVCPAVVIREAAPLRTDALFVAGTHNPGGRCRTGCDYRRITGLCRPDLLIKGTGVSARARPGAREGAGA
jgi:hypothetical protein